ncbi:hypothetical protein TSOC_001184, partial [Tetrabaena socialis]
HSTGSPIDGICGTAQRTTGAALAADVSFAHGMGAPEAYVLGPKQKDNYSFVDLNPASARKVERPVQSAALAAGTTAGGIVRGLANMAGDEATQQGSERRAGATLPSAAALVATAAATLLPPSPGSVVSNQDSCTVSGLVARAMAQQHVQEGQAVQQHNDPAAEASEADGREKLEARQAAGGGEMAIESRSPASASQRPGHSPGRCAAVGAGAAGDAGQRTDELLSAGMGPQLAPPGSPSPRTAKIMMYERMLDWHVDTVSLKPETCRLSHKASGMAFELRETLLDDEEAEAELLQSAQAGRTSSATGEGSKCFTYTPLALGLAAGSIPSFLKETIQISAHQRRELLQLLNNAIKAALKA